MFNRPRRSDTTSRLWRLDEVHSEAETDGALALLRAMIKLGLQHRRTLASAAGAGFLLAALYAYSLPPVYSATATLLLEPRQSAASGQEFGGPQTLDTNRADSELQTIKSERLLSAVFNGLDLAQHSEAQMQRGNGFVSWLFSPFRWRMSEPQTVSLAPTGRDIDTWQSPTEGERAAFSDFSRRLDARRVGQSYVIEISYNSSDRNLPAKVANATASAYIFQAVTFKEQTARAGTEVLQGRLDALLGQADAARKAVRAGSLPEIPTPDADARIIGAALTPIRPSAPRKTLIAALGGVLGLIGGFGVIMVTIALDRKVRDGRVLAHATGTVCFGTIPDTPGVDDPALPLDPALQHGFLAAIHDLRTSIELACASHRSDRNIAIALVSWETGAGVSTICTALAQLMSRGGRRVTLFQAPGERKNVQANGGDAGQPSSLADAVFANIPSDQLTFEQKGGIAILPIHSRDPAANLFADFRNPRVRQIIDVSRASGDVILDLPPLEGSMDAMALANFADAVVIVARAGHTTVDHVQEAVTLLKRVGVEHVGLVINRLPA